MQLIHVHSSHTRARRSSRRSRAAHRWSIQAKLIAVLFGLAAVAALMATVRNLTGTSQIVMIPAGTELVAVLKDPVSTASAHAGDAVVVETIEPLQLAGKAVLPLGTVVRGQVMEARGGRGAGGPKLTLQFNEMDVDGDTYQIVAEPLAVIVAPKGDQVSVPARHPIGIKLTQTLTVEYSRP